MHYSEWKFLFDVCFYTILSFLLCRHFFFPEALWATWNHSFHVLTLPFVFPNLDIEVYSCFLIGAIFGFTLARWCHGFQQPLLPFPVCLLEKWVTFRKEWGQNCLPRLQKVIGWRTVCTLKLFCETYLSPSLGFPTSWRESEPVMGWRERLQTYCIH